MAKGPSQIMQLSVLVPIPSPSRRGTFTARIGKYDFCTDLLNTYLLSPYPYVPFGINIFLVEARHHGDRSVTNYATFRSGPYNVALETGYFDDPHM